jgi:signal transduction histidine kinase/DNA-binding response OmpR family regulator
MGLVIAVVVLALAVMALAYAWMRERRQKAALAHQMDLLTRAAASHQQELSESRQLDALKDEFISTVSHELRTPLTSIRGALGLLSGGVMGHMDEKAANLLRIASSNTDRLVRLINDILDLERMDSGRAPMQLRSCSLRELVLQSVDTMSAMADAADVRLEIAPEPEGMTQAFLGDADRIQQVLVNLLSNAIKFSPRGATIVIRSSFERDALLLRIEDAGRGVPANKLETIFDRFSQVESGDARQKGGTGLGLAICRTILTQHNGRIWAERNDADGSDRPGSTFVIRLPRSANAERDGANANTTIGTILVADDDATVRHVVAEHLRHQGYTAIETGSGEQAIHIAETQPIDAILLDLYMPGLSGGETLERLKHNPATASIPVVVLSVLSPGTGSSSEAVNAQGWLQKPFHEGLLLSELGRVLHRGTGPARVLLVEDDEDLATLVKSSFELAGSDATVTLDHARSLAEAQQACGLAKPDLIILDLTLPDGSGFALVDWLRAQTALSTLPLVVYSGRDVSAQEKEKLRLGPTQFLAKARVQPSDVENLVLAMLRHMRS